MKRNVSISNSETKTYLTEMIIRTTQQQASKQALYFLPKKCKFRVCCMENWTWFEVSVEIKRQKHIENPWKHNAENQRLILLVNKNNEFKWDSISLAKVVRLCTYQCITQFSILFIHSILVFLLCLRNSESSNGWNFWGFFSIQQSVEIERDEK